MIQWCEYLLAQFGFVFWSGVICLNVMTPINDSSIREGYYEKIAVKLDSSNDIIASRLEFRMIGISMLLGRTVTVFNSRNQSEAR